MILKWKKWTDKDKLAILQCSMDREHVGGMRRAVWCSARRLDKHSSDGCLSHLRWNATKRWKKQSSKAIILTSEPSMSIDHSNSATEEGVFGALVSDKSSCSLPSLSLRSRWIQSVLSKINIHSLETIEALRYKPIRFEQPRAKFEGYGKNPLTMIQGKDSNSSYGCGSSFPDSARLDNTRWSARSSSKCSSADADCIRPPKM